jgi:hypothetical protein
MKRRLFFLGFGLAVLTIAAVGWTVQGARWACAAPARAFG